MRRVQRGGIAVRLPEKLAEVHHITISCRCSSAVLRIVEKRDGREDDSKRLRARDSIYAKDIISKLLLSYF